MMNTLIIGSGAAGLAAALRLHTLGVTDIAIYTEGLKLGTSINTGSDKQTYCKLGMYGDEADSPVQMAKDLAAGGAMHGDIALIEAALSPVAFGNLVSLGVPFPCDEFGQYIGYKTDHDPHRRATSCGPYTSREMCLKLIEAVKLRKIPVFERRIAVKILTDPERSRVIGAVFVNGETGELESVQAENIIFATGGPGGLYRTSVYPACHTGAIGLALEAGAAACNLAESQFGIASIKFRWNLSGSYMQVLPRLISTDAAGDDEREFLREYYENVEDMYNAVFLKGYQWPFFAGNVPGSSLIDIFIYIETVERGRRVWLDYRSDPEDLDISRLSEEVREYLSRSAALAGTPIARLEQMNPAARELYLAHNIDLAAEPLEAAVCAQHNNGGLAGNIWWESVNLKHLFPIGEVNGTHGVTRPGGSALNSGQVGAFRAAEYIAANYRNNTFDSELFRNIAGKETETVKIAAEIPAACSWQSERKDMQEIMSRCAGFVRSTAGVEEALDAVYRRYARLSGDGLGGLDAKGVAEALRNRQLCTAQILYLESILMQIDYIGSRGGSVVLAGDGRKIHPALGDKWCMAEEKKGFRDLVVMCRFAANGYPELYWEECRPVPETDGWFENVWHSFVKRNKAGMVKNG